MQNRINKIGEYFKTFNISDNIAYISITLPSKWQLPDINILEESFKVKVAPDDNGIIYFFTDVSNGIDTLFESVEFTISFNKDLEEKLRLLKEKVEYLKELFATNTLEDLKTIEIKLKTKRGKKAKKNEVVENEIIDEVPSKTEDETNSQDTAVNNEEVDENNNDMSLLEYATQIVEK